MARKSQKNLVIVESPAKAKTINKYLGDDYIVKASMGHVRDLPSRGGMGVDLETFKPEYQILESRGKVVSELRKLAKQADQVYLATDPDREGEAIAWHLQEALGVPEDRVKRVQFNAITKAEIQRAFGQPTTIDMDRVNAQQARRILDRVVGWEVSPVLWKKVAKGLSAGRVQSVAVRLIVDREREIEKFIPVEYWSIGGIFTTEADTGRGRELAAQWADFLANTGNGERTKTEREQWLAGHKAFQAELAEIGGKKFEATNKEQARRVVELLGLSVTTEQTTEDPEAKGPARLVTKIAGQVGKHLPFTVRGIEKKRVTRRPDAPLITSTLQQAASSRLGMGAQRAMRVAQGLYENGHITYMRTDSTNLSPEAIKMARAFVGREFGEKYVPEKPNYYTSSNKSAQEAHEAIRPTDATFTPGDARAKLSPDESRLYQLIWNRFVASQMPPAEFDQTTVTLAASTAGGDATFRASGRKLVFDGFMRVTGVSSEDQLLPELRENQPVAPLDFVPTQHFTQPPPRFSEATLVKELERLGIGRPSTYASIIDTIEKRQYAQQINRRFHATMLGSVVTDKLLAAFPQIMDVQFTADMELKLDQIEEKHLDWIKLLRDFYGPFHQEVDGALGKIDHAGGTPSPYACPKCGGPMVYRISKNGFFLACANRECSQTQPVDQQGKPTVREVSEHKCPNCGREMIKRRGRFGFFLGCSGYSVKNEKGEPSCSTIINLDKDGNPLPPKPPPVKTDIPCPKCKSPMLLRNSKRGPFLGCSSFPKCRGIVSVKKLDAETQKKVEALLPALKEGAEAAQQMVAKLLGTGATPATQTGPIATDIDCDECGKPMVIREGRRGKFLGCSGYPKCKNTAEVPAKLVEELGLNGGEPAAAEPAAKAKRKSRTAPIEPESDED